MEAAAQGGFFLVITLSDLKGNALFFVVQAIAKI